MRKSLVLAITALGGGASYGAGVVQTSPAMPTPDPAIWRWHVSAILDDQKRAAEPSQKVAANFDHLYQRYTDSGLPRHR